MRLVNKVGINIFQKSGALERYAPQLLSPSDMYTCRHAAGRGEDVADEGLQRVQLRRGEQLARHVHGVEHDDRDAAGRHRAVARFVGREREEEPLDQRAHVIESTNNKSETKAKINS